MQPDFFMNQVMPFPNSSYLQDAVSHFLTFYFNSCVNSNFSTSYVSTLFRLSWLLLENSLVLKWLSFEYQIHLDMSCNEM